MTTEDDEGLTYAEAGVDIEASEAATSALLSAVGEAGDESYAGVLDLGEIQLGLTTDGVGTKILVAEALDSYDTIGIDCIAMNVNDLIAAGLRPVGFVDYLALEEPDETVSADIGAGLAEGAKRANVSLMGGETAILPEVIDGVDLAGAAVGIAQPGERPSGVASAGDTLIGLPSSGIHSNGLTLARTAVTQSHAYTDELPWDTDHSIGEALLTPTRIYTEPIEAMRRFEVNACAHVTGGGLRNLTRMGEFHYEVEDPFEVPEIFDFIQDCGGISDEEMYQTFNMGIGFVMAVSPEDAKAAAEAIGGQVIGTVKSGSGVTIRDLHLEQ